MLIQDVQITLPTGEKREFKGVAKKVVAPITDAIAVMQLTTALDTAMGFIVLQPGMVVDYTNSVVTSSQVADNGMVPVKKEADEVI